jgi:hypothetical protein
MTRIIPDDEAPPDPPPSDPPSAAGLSKRLRRGIEGGALGTVVMTVFRLPVTRSLPPSADFWAQFVRNGRATDYPIAGLFLHLLYGVSAGALFSAVLPSRESVRTSGGRRGPPTAADRSIGGPLAVVYGALLSLFGERVLLHGLLDIGPDDRYAFHAGHLIYGLTLGAWFATRTDDDRG